MYVHVNTFAAALDAATPEELIDFSFAVAAEATETGNSIQFTYGRN